jgi:hypothetical protein
MTESTKPEPLEAFYRRLEEKHLAEHLTYHRILTIIEWSVEMRRKGLMPDEVARAFREHFGADHFGAD